MKMTGKLNFKCDDCFVFPEELPKKSTRCLCVKITNKTSGPNDIKLWTTAKVRFANLIYKAEVQT